MGNGDDVGKRHQHDIAAGEGDLGRDAGTFGGDRFLGDLDQYPLVGREHAGDLAALVDILLHLQVGQQRIRILPGGGQAYQFQQRLGLRAEVEVMQERVLFVTYVDECRIQTGNQFLTRPR